MCLLCACTYHLRPVPCTAPLCSRSVLTTSPCALPRCGSVCPTLVHTCPPEAASRFQLFPCAILSCITRLPRILPLPCYCTLAFPFFHSCTAVRPLPTFLICCMRFIIACKTAIEPCVLHLAGQLMTVGPDCNPSRQATRARHGSASEGEERRVQAQADAVNCRARGLVSKGCSQQAVGMCSELLAMWLYATGI